MRQFIFLFFVLLSFSAMSQKIVLSGTVTTVAGVPLEGASVRSASGNTTTNKTGTFTLPVTAMPAVIFVSHVGYKTKEIKTGISNTYLIVLKEASLTMKEVTVSNGYQEIKKESSTGSYDKVDNALLNRTPSIDVLSRLEGVIPDLYVQKTGGSQGIFIRGLSTLRASTTPLIVLDNFPYDGNINNINPTDVESITILKDAAAAAIWGARAGNGVIVITTKKGKYGEKTKLNFSSSLSLQGKPDIFKDPAFLNANDFIDVEKFLFSKGKFDADLSNTTSHPIVSPVVEILAKQRSGLLSAADAEAQINALRNIDVRGDYEKYLYQVGARQQYSLGLSGGSATINYLVNGGYDKNVSNAVGNQNDRATFYAVTNIRPVKKLEVQVGINYTYSKNVNDNIGTIAPLNKGVLYPYARLADSAGNALPVEFTYRNTYLDTAGSGLLLDWKYRPLDEMKFRDNTSLTDDILLKAGLHYHVGSGFDAEVSGQYEKSYTYARNYSSLQSFTARNLINKFSQRSGTGILHNLPVGGVLAHTESNLGAYAVRAQLNYNRAVWKGQLTAIAGTEIRQQRSVLQSATLYGYDDNTLVSSPVNTVTSYPLYGSLGSGTIPAGVNAGDILNRFVSFYSNATYTYKNYTVSTSARKDASNLFGVTTNNKWTPLWSAGLGWKVPVKTFLRLRLTYGYNGNVNNDLAAVPTIRYATVDATTNLPYAQVNTLPNPHLRWEKVGTLNAGLDLSSGNERLSGSIEYFHKNGTDLIYPSLVDPTIGLSLLSLNSANLSGQGLDIKMNWKVLDNAFKFSTYFIFSYVTNKVTRLNYSVANKGSYTGTNYVVNPIEGKDPFSLISYKWGGLDPQTGDPLGYINGNLSNDYVKLVATTSLDDLVFSGPTRPPYFGNFIPSFSWKGITLSANISYKFGFYFRRSSLNYNSFFSSWVSNSEFVYRWQKPGDELNTFVPSMVYPANSNRDKFYNNSEATVEKGDLVRLQDVTLSYQPLKRFKNFRLYAYAGSVALLWRANKRGIDPDYGIAVPPPMTWTFGLQTNL